MSSSVYIRAMHPQTEISPDPVAIRRILNSGWGAQLKIHGHRAQIHIPQDSKVDILVYNRQGQFHKAKLAETLDLELRRLLTPKTDYNVIDAEWLKTENKIFIFDVLKYNGQLLRSWNYIDRWQLLPRVYRSEYIETLEIIRSVEKCLAVLAEDNPLIEGLVFKSLESPGFDDTAIVRCRKRKI